MASLSLLPCGHGRGGVDGYHYRSGHLWIALRTAWDV